MMRTDVVKLRQCLFNLLSNASKFTQDGRISLTARRKGEGDRAELIFAVTDSGIGIRRAAGSARDQSCSPPPAGSSLHSAGLPLAAPSSARAMSRPRVFLAGAGSITPWFGPVKLLATAVSSISGIPGGIFSPSLAVGAGLGRDLAPLMPQVPLGVFAILGMTAYLTGVVQAPLTSFVIVSEMTQNHTLVIPIMLASLVAQAASKLVCPEVVYHALSEHFMS